MEDAGQQVAGQISRFLHGQVVQDLKHGNKPVQFQIFRLVTINNNVITTVIIVININNNNGCYY